jgi:hypothetical protein
MQPNVQHHRRPEERSIPELFSDLTQETTELVRKEVELAKVEISQKVSRLETGIVSLAIGGAVAFAGALVLLAAAMLGVDALLHLPWLSALIVGGAITLVGIGLLVKGRSDLAAADVTPERSVESLRKDKDLAMRHVG